MFVLPFGIMKNKECRNDTLETRSAWLHALLPCNIALIAHKAGYHAVQHCLSQAVGLSYIWRRVETFNSWHGDVTGTVCRVTSYIVRLLQPRCTINSLVVKATQPLYLPAAAAASMLHDTTPRNAFNDQCVMTHLSQAVQLSRRLSPSPSRQPWRPCLFLADWRRCSSGPSVVDELAACNDARRRLAGHLPIERQCVCPIHSNDHFVVFHSCYLLDERLIESDVGLLSTWRSMLIQRRNRRPKRLQHLEAKGTLNVYL